MVCWLPRLKKKNRGQNSKSKKNPRENSECFREICAVHLLHTYTNTQHNLRVTCINLQWDISTIRNVPEKAEVEGKNTPVVSLDETLAGIYQAFLTPLTFLYQLVHI